MVVSRALWIVQVSDWIHIQSYVSDFYLHWLPLYIGQMYDLLKDLQHIAQAGEAVEYTDCISAEG